MTFKHRLKFFISNIQRKFKNNEAVKEVIEKKKNTTFLDFLMGRVDDLEKQLNNLHGFTESERKTELMVRERIDELNGVIGAFEEYGKK